MEAGADINEDKLNDIGLSNDLKTHKSIHTNHGYNLLKLGDGYAKISIDTNKSETVENNMIYDGLLFSAANFCAMAAINEEHSFLLSANIDFLNQVSSSDEDIIFEAHAKNNISGKKRIDVNGKVNDITIFNGNFTAIKLENSSLIKST